MIRLAFFVSTGLSIYKKKAEQMNLSVHLLAFFLLKTDDYLVALIRIRSWHTPGWRACRTCARSKSGSRR